MTKRCRKCSTLLLVTNWSGAKKEKFDYICNECDAAASRERYHKNREARREQQASYYQDNKERIVDNATICRWKRKYGITEDEYYTILEEQDGRCAICKTLKGGKKGQKFAVDHNHVTGEVRGLLCRDCNAGIGLLKDSKSVLQEAINYLEENGSYGDD